MRRSMPTTPQLINSFNNKFNRNINNRNLNKNNNKNAQANQYNDDGEDDVNDGDGYNDNEVNNNQGGDIDDDGDDDVGDGDGDGERNGDDEDDEVTAERRASEKRGMKRGRFSALSNNNNRGNGINAGRFGNGNGNGNGDGDGDDDQDGDGDGDGDRPGPANGWRGRYVGGGNGGGGFRPASATANGLPLPPDYDVNDALQNGTEDSSKQYFLDEISLMREAMKSNPNDYGYIVINSADRSSVGPCSTLQAIVSEHARLLRMQNKARYVKHMTDYTIKGAGMIPRAGEILKRVTGGTVDLRTHYLKDWDTNLYASHTELAESIGTMYDQDGPMITFSGKQQFAAVMLGTAFATVSSNIQAEAKESILPKQQQQQQQQQQPNNNIAYSTGITWNPSTQAQTPPTIVGDDPRYSKRARLASANNPLVAKPPPPLYIPPPLDFSSTAAAPTTGAGGISMAALHHVAIENAMGSVPFAPQVTPPNNGNGNGNANGNASVEIDVDVDMDDSASVGVRTADLDIQ